MILFHSKAVTTKKGNKGMTTHFLRGSVIWLNYYVDGVRKQKSTKLKDTPQNIKIVKDKIIPALDIKIATGEIYKKKSKTLEYYGGIFLKQKSNDKFQYALLKIKYLALEEPKVAINSIKTDALVTSKIPGLIQFIPRYNTLEKVGEY